MRDISSQSTKPPPENCGGIVLCGGSSKRMGQSKAWLPFGNETCLQRVVRILSECVSPVVVVAAPEQQLPPLPAAVTILRDQREGLGPLAGLALGLEHLAPITEAAYVSGCDVPLLIPATITYIVSQLGTFDAAVVREGDFVHPLAGVYRTSLAAHAWHLIHQEQRRAQLLAESSNSHSIPVDELRTIDLHLRSLENMNTPDDYERLLALASKSVN